MTDRSNDRLIRLPEVLRRTGLSRSTIYGWIENGRFPRQVQLSARCVAWYESEVNEWIAARPRRGSK
ncbi:helix-turn-helix transcriptional regulator [Sphingomonas changnyeongensis]|nr:AlpA family transcriptional regulator [Sphingomonas changnyeongensis]